MLIYILCEELINEVDSICFKLLDITPKFRKEDIFVILSYK
jgi:hypothetical protein